MVRRKHQTRSRSQADNVTTAVGHVFNDRAERSPTIKDPYFGDVVSSPLVLGAHCHIVSVFPLLVI